MPDSAKATKAAPPAVEWVSSDKFIKIYSNGVQLEVSPWDFRFTFGEVLHAAPLQIEKLVTVTMSPQHAKALLSILATNIQQYEKNVGEIRLPQPDNPDQQQGKQPAGATMKHGPQ